MLAGVTLLVKYSGQAGAALDRGGQLPHDRLFAVGRRNGLLHLAGDFLQRKAPLGGDRHFTGKALGGGKR